MNTSETQNEKPVEVPQDLEKVDFFNRIIAKIIDFIIVAALYETIPKAGYFAGIVYLSIADGLFEGRSAGKRLIGLKVVMRNEDGTTSPCGFRESIFRNFPFTAGYILYGILKAVPLIGGIISFVIAAAILLFESLVILGSEEGIRLGDELAKTRVVKDIQGG